MSEIDDLIASLQSPEDIFPYTLPEQPGVTELHVADHGTIKQVLGLLRTASSAHHPSLYVPAEKYGAQAGGSFDNTAAIQDAVDEAIATGAMGVSLPLCEPGDHFYIEGRVNFGTVDLVGNGPNSTIFECVDPGAGFDFSEYDDTLQNGGYSGHFSMWGGPSAGNGIATRPFVVGKRVSWRLSNIHSWYADPDTGCNLVLDSTQNSLIDTPWLADAACPLRFDRGASSSVILKGEVAMAYDSNVQFRATSESPAGQFPYTLDNTLFGTIIEGSYASTQHMVHSEAGALNKLANCYASVNGAIFGGAAPSAMNQAIYAEASESVQSSLMIDNLQLACGNAVTVGVEADVASGARIHWKGGSMGATPLGMRGNVIVEAEPWFFATVTQKYDEAGILSVIPRHPQNAPAYIRKPSSSGVVWGVHVDGEANLRAYMTADGIIRWSNGTATSDVLFGRVSAGVVGSTESIKAFGSLITSTGLQAPVASATGPVGTVVGKMEIRNPSTGSLYGYIPVYNTIT